MGESEVRRRKRAELAESARKRTPAQRLRRAAVMTEAGLKLRAAGRKALSRGSIVREGTEGAKGSPFRELAAVLAILRGLEIPHALIGGWAVIAWGSLRTSEDLDLIVDLPPSRRKALLDALSEVYDAQWVEGGEDDPIPFLVRARPKAEDGFPVDLLVVRKAADRAALSRSVEITAEGVAIRLVRPEDLIAMKLAAGGGQDYEDVRRLLEVQAGRLDERLLHNACAARGALGRLANLRR